MQNSQMQELNTQIQELTMDELQQVNGGKACVMAAGLLAVSPLGGPWTVAGAFVGAYIACMK